MVVKRELAPPEPHLVPTRELAQAETADLFVTRSDHWGLRLRVEGAALQVYPRMCPHEGACLDEQPVERSLVKCPWHGRMLRPLATLAYPLTVGAAPVELRHHRLVPTAEGLRIEFKDSPLAEKAEPSEQAPALTI